LNQMPREEPSLDEWLGIFERIYFFSQNHERGVHQIHLRVYEASLNLQNSALKRRDYAESKEKWLPKLFAWYCALLKCLRIRGLETLVWNKFPGVCPFCVQERCKCEVGRPKNALDPSVLAKISRDNIDRRPSTLGQWQRLFDSIYHQTTRGLALRTAEEGQEARGILVGGFLKLYEELTELSEAIRLRPFFPDNLKNEVADVFVSICGLANVLSTGFRAPTTTDLGLEVWRRYPDTCDTCSNRVCTCRHNAVRERLSSEGVREFERRDGLTGLYNLEQYRIDRERYFGAPPDEEIAELFIDCDHFKKFNDETPGAHAQGDAVLRYIASRASASVGSSGIAYRRGGDEFSILIRGPTTEQIREVAKRIVDDILEGSVPNVVGGEPYKVRISAGLSFRTEATESSDDLSAHADANQYEAKRQGGGRLNLGG
jgi:diguanylate cyclase (GGDEF)-like protein